MKPCPICQYDGVIVRGWPLACDICKWEGEAESTPAEAEQAWMEDEDPPKAPSLKAVEYADYILNHYSGSSRLDKLCLASDLERHGWKPSKTNLSRPKGPLP